MKKRVQQLGEIDRNWLQAPSSFLCAAANKKKQTRYAKTQYRPLEVWEVGCFISIVR